MARTVVLAVAAAALAAVIAVSVRSAGAAGAGCPLARDDGFLVAELGLEKQVGGKWRAVAWDEALRRDVPFRFRFKPNRKGFVTLWAHPAGSGPPERLWPRDGRERQFVAAGDDAVVPARDFITVNGGDAIERFSVVLGSEPLAEDPWRVADIRVRTATLSAGRGAKPVRACFSAAPNAKDKPAVIRFSLRGS